MYCLDWSGGGGGPGSGLTKVRERVCGFVHMDTQGKSHGTGSVINTAGLIASFPLLRAFDDAVTWPMDGMESRFVLQMCRIIIRKVVFSLLGKRSTIIREHAGRTISYILHPQGTHFDG